MLLIDLMKDGFYTNALIKSTDEAMKMGVQDEDAYHVLNVIFLTAIANELHDINIQLKGDTGNEKLY